MDVNKENELLKVINFKTDDIYASIDIHSLHKIIALPQINAITDAPVYVIGMMNFSGSVIPVVDLFMRVKEKKPNRYTISIPLLICNRKNGSKIGVIVESVCDFTTIKKENLEKYMLGNDKLFTAAIKYPSKLSLLIDVDYIIPDYDIDKRQDIYNDK